METIKNTVSNLVGYGSNNDPATDGTSSATTTTGTTDHTATSGTTTAHTPASGATGDHIASAHHQTTTGSGLGDTVSSATGGSSTGSTGLGHDTSTTTGHGASGLTGTSHSTGPTSGSDLTDTSRTTAGTSGLTGSSHTSSTTHAASDTAGISRDNKPGDIDVPHKQDSHHHHDPTEIQSPAQGPDPALVGEPESHVKLSGAGVPGSHSAVFGLTPDGKRHDDTSHSTTTVAPAHSAETTMGRKSVAAGGVLGGEGGVSNQIDAPDGGKKGLERTDPLPSGLKGSDGKPGAGLTSV